MPKAKPTILHVNSMGKKRLMLHSIIYDKQKQYLFYPMDGIRKTDVYNRGFLVGKREGIRLYEDFEEALEKAPLCVLVIPRKEIERKNHSFQHSRFIGKVPLSDCLQINTKEVVSFIENYCLQCEWYGEEKCFLLSIHDCGDAERDKYSDSVWIENQRESMKRRKIERQRKREARDLPFPVNRLGEEHYSMPQ